MAAFNSRIAFCFSDRFLSVPEHRVRLQLPQMPAFPKAGPGGGRNAASTPQQAAGRRAPRGAQPRSPARGLCRPKASGQNKHLQPQPSCKGEHRTTLLSPLAFLKVSSRAGTVFFCVMYCILPAGSANYQLANLACFYVVLP